MSLPFEPTPAQRNATTLNGNDWPVRVCEQAHSVDGKNQIARKYLTGLPATSACAASMIAFVSMP